MAYTHFRYIAYEVPTASSEQHPPGATASAFDAGTECEQVKRIPINDPDSKLHPDAKKRLRRLALVVEKAARHLESLRRAGRDNDSTLKVFVTPEFYFRPPAALGADFHSDTYSETQMKLIFGQLDSMFKDPAFKHWLIIGGTVMWNLAKGRSHPITGIGTAKERTFFNTAVVMLGGRNQGLRFFEKRVASDLDGIPTIYAPGSELSGFRLVFEQWSELKKRIVEMDGTGVGIEVCLDHLDADLPLPTLPLPVRPVPIKYDPIKDSRTDTDTARTLKKIRNRWAQYENPRTYPKDFFSESRVSLHVLTACGMDIEEGSVAADVGGYILRNDGFSPSGPDATPDAGRSDLELLQSELRQISEYKTAGGTSNKFSPIVTSAVLGPRAKPEIIGTPMVDAMKVPMKGGRYYEFKQRLIIYKPLPLPN